MQCDGGWRALLHYGPDNLSMGRETPVARHVRIFGFA